MLCYRDMTFCGATDCKDFDFCHRAKTEKIIDAAESIEMDICEFTNPKELDCYEKM